jgi:O-acetyl-ADP-ribose deacetylase (regulator of RNase III)
MHRFLEGQVIVKVGDLTQEDVDAIVNAANSSLMGGGGVDGAIHDAGGPEILAECKEARRKRYPNGLPTGQAVITTGGRLPARYVIHTVGPIYGQSPGNEAQLLGDCYKNSITLAAEKSLRSIAFPSISTGAFAYPREEAAEISSRAVRSAVVETRISEVRLVFHSRGDMEVFIRNSRF